MILSRLFQDIAVGFYVDVGAHHPVRFSNTYLFYRQGWRGINIDAMPGSMASFRRYRPRDINLNVAVGISNEPLTYFIFNESALNGFSSKISLDRHHSGGSYRIVDRVQIKPDRLDEILEMHLPQGQRIDFLSVDVEGMDLSVLQSNDWTRYRPKFVLIEMLQSTLADIDGSAINKLLAGHGYSVYAKTMNTVFFQNKRDQ